MIRSKSTGKSWFRRVGGAGSRSRIARKITARSRPEKPGVPWPFRRARRQTKKVRSCVHLLAHRLFRRHIRNRSHRRAGTGQQLLWNADWVGAPASATLAPVVTLANPKSKTLASPRFVMKMFAGLMSR